MKQILENIKDWLFIISGIVVTILIVLALTGKLDTAFSNAGLAGKSNSEKGVVYETDYDTTSSQAVETTKTADKKQNSIISFIGLLVLVSVAFITYKVMYAGTAIIGTHEGIMGAIGRRLVIPVIVGAIAAGIVMKILEFIGSILMILIILAVIGAAGYFVYNKFLKKDNN